MTLCPAFVGTPTFWRVYIGGLILVAWLAPEPSPAVRRALAIFIVVWWLFWWSERVLRKCLAGTDLIAALYGPHRSSFGARAPLRRNLNGRSGGFES